MGKYGRTTLICSRILLNGVPEYFRVSVRDANVRRTQKNYESQGYTVTIVEEG